jgi:hypothetical protein
MQAMAIDIRVPGVRTSEKVLRTCGSHSRLKNSLRASTSVRTTNIRLDSFLTNCDFCQFDMRDLARISARTFAALGVIFLRGGKLESFFVG